MSERPQKRQKSSEAAVQPDWIDAADGVVTDDSAEGWKRPAMLPLDPLEDSIGEHLLLLLLLLALAALVCRRPLPSLSLSPLKRRTPAWSKSVAIVSSPPHTRRCAAHIHLTHPPLPTQNAHSFSMVRRPGL